MMTVTMEGVLEIWDFDTSKHALYKNQAISAKILDDTTCSPAFDVVKNKFLPRLFMVLTNKNILVHILLCSSMHLANVDLGHSII